MADKQPAADKKTDNWAEMSDGEPEEEQPEEQKGEEKQHTIKPAKKNIPAAKKGFKNKDGDYVVSTIDIPDMRTGVKEKDEEGNEVETDSDTEYDDEDDTKETKPVEEESKEGK